MALVRKTFPDRESWLAGRGSGIGASEAGAVLGVSPWKTPTQLWMEKIGAQDAPDLSDSAVVQRGVRLEPVLRDLYAAQHPEYDLHYGQFDILSQDDRPWLTATLDGELTETETGRKGVLEIKTASVGKRTDWEKWQNAIPPQYFAQVLHQFLATGYDFVDLFACLINLDGDMTIRNYHTEREDYKDDMDYLLEKETEFWAHVQNRTMPPVKIGGFGL